MREINKSDKYTIYKIQNPAACDYYLCIPTNNFQHYELYIGLIDIELGGLSDEELVTTIKPISDSIFTISDYALLVIPAIPTEELKRVSSENEDRTYSPFFEKNIHPIALEMASKYPIDKSDVVNIVSLSDAAKKISGWLATKYVNWIVEIDYYKLVETADKLKQTKISEAPTATDIQPVNHRFNNPQSPRSKKLTKTSGRNTDNSSGFGNIKFIIVTLLSSLMIGVGIAYWLIK